MGRRMGKHIVMLAKLLERKPTLCWPSSKEWKDLAVGHPTPQSKRRSSPSVRYYTIFQGEREDCKNIKEKRHPCLEY